MWAVQELVWRVRPDLIIETGIAHGGSLILSASMLAMLDYCDAMAAGTPLDPRQSKRKVIGIDIDIRPHNRAALDAHPLRPLLHLVEGSSIAPETVAAVKTASAEHKTVMVFLDSMHTHAHVLAELEAYAPMVSKDSYCVVFDSSWRTCRRIFSRIGPGRPATTRRRPCVTISRLIRNSSSTRPSKVA